MRTVPAALDAHLKRQATTTARAWRLTRGDGAVLGFTDHDAPLTFAGTRFEAASGVGAGEAEAMLGLGAGTQEIEGALSSDAIEEADILAGRYDGARVEIFVVNWQAPDEHLLLDVAEIGEVKRGGPAFSAELRGIASRLDRLRGRLYRRRCDAVLGDRRCGVDLSAAHLSRDVVFRRTSGSAIVAAAAGGGGGGGRRSRAVRRRASRLDERDGRGAFGRDPRGSSPRRRRASDRDDRRAADRPGGRRRTAASRRLRQELRDLPVALRKRPQLPGLPASAGQRCRHGLRQDGRSARRRAGGAMRNESEMRARVLAAAHGFLGTPYRHQGSRRGVGCDCLGLVRGVWREIHGGEPEIVGPYTPDWAERSTGEPLIEAARRHFREIEPGDAAAGDLLVFRWRPGSAAKHCGILAREGRLIHAYEGAAVVSSPLGSAWTRRIAGAFRFPEA